MEQKERYLTEKNRPGRMTRVLENVAIMACFVLLCAYIYIIVVGIPAVVAYVTLGAILWPRLILVGLLLLIPAVVLVLALNFLTERIRRRLHAQRIVRALMATETGCIPADELEAACGVRAAARVVGHLTEKGYLQDVRIIRGQVCLGEAEVEAEEPTPATPIFRDLES